MKRTELKRKTPLPPGKPPKAGEPPKRKALKRGGKIRKKPRPRDRDLWTNKQWRGECDTIWSRVVRLKAMQDRPEVYCAVCATLPPAERVDATQWHAHHLINRGQMFYRHIIENGICLCSRHHNNDAYFSAELTPYAFEAWLKEHRPDQYAWYMKNRWETHPGLKIDYQQVHSVLIEQLKELERAA